MPARNRQSGGMKFYNIFKGKFTLKVPEAHEGNTYMGEDIVTRTNVMNKEVREIHYNALDDLLLVDIKEVDHAEWGKSYDFIFMDGNEYIQVRFSSGSLATSMLIRMENILIDKPVNIELYFFEKDGDVKEKSTLNLFQNGEKLKRLYTKEDPGKLPPPEKKEVNGKSILDWTASMKYWTVLIADLRTKLPGVHTDSADAAQEQSTETPEHHEPTETAKTETPEPDTLPPTQEDEGDDLPF